MKGLKYSVIIVFSIIVILTDGYAEQVKVNTHSEVILSEVPKRVVSLVPEITDIIVKLQATNSLVGVTYYSYKVPHNIKRVGGFLTPSVDEILALKPDLIFISSIHKNLKKRLQKYEIKVIELQARGISDILENIHVVGEIFDKEKLAEDIIESIKYDIDFVNKKLDQIAILKRKKVVRIMGRDRVMAPGDDSFQNDYIKAAGGIPPRWGIKGQMVKVDQKQWREFNPEVIYYCGKDSRIIDFIKKSEGWKDVIAVQKGRIYSFPCELTCRASVNAGYFIKWLFSSIYEEELFSSTKLLYTEGIYSRRKIELPLTYVESAEIVYSKLKDYTSKALLIRFKTPMNIVSTLEGQRTGIMTVGNHYLPPNLWSWAHRIGLEGSRDYVYKILRLNRADSSLLFTGADMDNLAIVKKSFKAMSVYALVTAGVRSNAVRTSVDVGRFYEPGTINIILMTNMKLTPRAMTRAIITATEAKTAALQDLDIRSSQTPIESQATGTGTDNIIVVQGTGYQIDNSGGHTKMGELIGNAVYDAVIQAIKKQNGIEKDRDVFQRLLERGISLYDVVFSARLPEDVNKKELLAKLEALLLKPEYAGFMLTALELSNSKNNYLKESFKRWAENIVSEIKGKQAQVIPIVEKSKWPVPIKIAFDALIGGIIEN